MTAADVWPFWLGAGGALAALIASLVIAYGARDDVRKSKFIFALIALGTTLVCYGGVALGLTERTRSDGIEVFWGPPAVAVLTHGPVLAVVTLALSIEWVDVIIALVLGTAQALCVLFATLTPIQNHGNPESAVILFVVLAELIAVLAGVFILAIALNYSRFLFFPRPYRLEDGRANMNHRWNWVLAPAVWVCLALYGIIYAIGPAGWREFTSQFTYTWVWLAPCDLLYVFVLLLICVYWFNPDGASSTATAFESFSAATPLMATAVSSSSSSSMMMRQQPTAADIATVVASVRLH